MLWRECHATMRVTVSARSSAYITVVTLPWTSHKPDGAAAGIRVGPAAFQPLVIRLMTAVTLMP
jgi:hypothetical protein